MSLVSDRILDLAVARVKNNLANVQVNRGMIPEENAYALVRAHNEQLLISATEAAQLVLDAEPKAARVARFRNDMKKDREVDTAVTLLDLDESDAIRYEEVLLPCKSCGVPLSVAEEADHDCPKKVGL